MLGVYNPAWPAALHVRFGCVIDCNRIQIDWFPRHQIGRISLQWCCVLVRFWKRTVYRKRAAAAIHWSIGPRLQLLVRLQGLGAPGCVLVEVGGARQWRWFVDILHSSFIQRVVDSASGSIGRLVRQELSGVVAVVRVAANRYKFT